MKNTLAKYLVAGASVVALFGACRKDAYETDSASGRGQSFIRIYEAPLRNNFLAPFTDVQSASLFSIRRDAKDNAALKTDVTVTLSNLGANYITTNYPDYEFLPASFYTAGDGVTLSGNDAVVNIPSGADITKFQLKLDGSKFDLSKKYAIAYVISNSGGLAVKAGKDTIVATIGIKNDYDGLYTGNGFLIRYLSGFGGPVDTDLGGHFEKVTYTMSTAGKYKNYFSQFWADGSGVAGIDGTNIVVDPTTNKVTISADTNPSLVNTAGYNSHYDPATKTFYLGFEWGTVNGRSTKDTLVYKGPSN